MYDIKAEVVNLRILQIQYWITFRFGHLYFFQVIIINHSSIMTEKTVDSHRRGPSYNQKIWNLIVTIVYV